jgi:hypothetical protein
MKNLKIVIFCTIPVFAVLPEQHKCDRVAGRVLRGDAGAGEGDPTLRARRARAAKGAALAAADRLLSAPRRQPPGGRAPLSGRAPQVPRQP